MRYWILFLVVSLFFFSQGFALYNLGNFPEAIEEYSVFSKFTLDFPQRYTIYAKQEVSPALRTLQKITFNTIKFSLSFVKDKTAYLNCLYKFLDYPHTWKSSLYDYVFSDLFNRHKATYSTLQFSDIRNNVEKNTIYQRRLDRDFAEHSNIIRFNANIKEEFAVGNYLFWVIEPGFTIFWNQELGYQSKENYRGVWIIKAWDTHWQEFAELKSKNIDLITYPDIPLTIKDKKLELTLNLLNPKKWKNSWEEFIDAKITFQLQKDASRRVVSCILENSEIWRKICDNLQILVTTKLSK